MKKNILKIINEELTNLNKETSGSHDYHFISSLENRNISVQNSEKLFQNLNYNDIELGYEADNINIMWSLDLWPNKQGIEDYQIIVDGIKGNVKIFVYNKNNGEDIDEKDIQLENKKWRFQIESPHFSENNSLYVNNIEFDFQTMICKISF